MKSRQTRRTTLNTRGVPVDVKAQFKAYCARRRYSMQAAIIGLMQKAVDDDLELPSAKR